MRKQTNVICYDISNISRLCPAPSLFGMKSEELFNHLVVSYVHFRKMCVLDARERLSMSSSVISMLLTDPKIPHLDMYIRDKATVSAYKTYVTKLFHRLDDLFVGSHINMAIPAEMVNSYGYYIKWLSLKTFGLTTILIFQKGSR